MAAENLFQCSTPRQLTLLRVAGKDAGKFLHNFCTNHINRLQPGDGCEAFSCDAKGRILFHWSVALVADAYWVSTDGSVAEQLITHLDKFHFREELTMEDLSSTWNEWLFLGSPPTSLPELAAQYAGLSDKMYAVSIANIQGQVVILQRLPIFGSQITHLYAPREIINNIVQSVHPSCLQLTDTELQRRRISMGWPMPHVDYDEKTLPQELNRDTQAISFNKGCYLGQETVARLDALGQVQRKLVGFTFKQELPTVPFTLKQDEKEIATISSVSFSPKEEMFIGLGFARRGYFQPGTVLSHANNPITVTALPILGDW